MKTRNWLIGIAVLVFVSVLIIVMILENKEPKQNVSFQSTTTLNKPQKLNETVNTTAKLRLRQPALDNTSLSSSKPSKLKQEYVVECKEPFAELEKRYKNEPAIEIADIWSQWSDSNKFEHQLALAITKLNESVITLGAAPKGDYVEPPLLSELVNKNPNSALTNYFLVMQCVQTKSCPDSTFDIATSNDPYNAALWKLMAIRHATDGNLEATLDSLQRHIVSPNYNEFWAETLHLLEKSLADIGVTDRLSRQIMAMGFSAAISLTNPIELINFCRDNAATRADVAQACIESGEKQYHSGNTMFEKSIGLSTQEITFEKIGKKEHAKEIEKQLKVLGKSMSYYSKAHNLTMFDKELNNYWWENLVIYGEIRSAELTYLEAIRKSKDPNYDPCPNGKVEKSLSKTN